jgi:hypothetical protein
MDIKEKPVTHERCDLMCHGIEAVAPLAVTHRRLVADVACRHVRPEGADRAVDRSVEVPVGPVVPVEVGPGTVRPAAHAEAGTVADQRPATRAEVLGDPDRPAVVPVEVRRAGGHGGCSEGQGEHDGDDCPNNDKLELAQK